MDTVSLAKLQVGIAFLLTRLMLPCHLYSSWQLHLYTNRGGEARIYIIMSDLWKSKEILIETKVKCCNVGLTMDFQHIRYRFLSILPKIDHHVSDKSHNKTHVGRAKIQNVRRMMLSTVNVVWTVEFLRPFCFRQSQIFLPNKRWRVALVCLEIFSSLLT